MPPRGKYREEAVDGVPATARVTDGTATFDVPEARYRENGYQPPFDSLPVRAPGASEPGLAPEGGDR